MEYSEAYGLDNRALTDAEQRSRIGQINLPAQHHPASRLAPPSSAQLRVPGIRTSTSSAGYAEVYEHRQGRLPGGMRGNDTASGSRRTAQQQVREDVPLGPAPRVPSMNQMSAVSTPQPRRDEREADGEMIYDVGITDYDNNVQNEAQPSQNEVRSRTGAQADDKYEVPLSVPSKYMNKEEENIYLEIDDVEMETRKKQDMDDDDDDDYDDTEL